MMKVRAPASRRMITLEVLSTERISPSFQRLTLGAQLHRPPLPPRPRRAGDRVRPARRRPGLLLAQRARPGDPAGIFDEGITYLPTPAATWHLLAGEESALPAILSILESAPPELQAEVFLEVPLTADIRPEVTHPDGVRVHWLARDGSGARPGALVLDAVKNATLPDGPSYTWTAGESTLPTGLRRHLVTDRQVPKSEIAFIGYWRLGRSSPG
jgi:NADPH-dependent ferric siderophore reductase